MNKIVYIVIGFLVTLVVLLSGLVGFFYGQTMWQIKTTTFIETKTVKESITKTVTVTVTNTETPFTRFERIESISSYVVIGYKSQVSSFIRYYNVTFLWRNVGTADTNIVDIIFNEKPLKTFWPSAEVYLNGSSWISGTDSSFKPIPFLSGSTLNLVILFPSNITSPFVSGQTIEVKVVTSHGVFYVTIFNIP